MELWKSRVYIFGTRKDKIDLLAFLLVLSSRMSLLSESTIINGVQLYSDFDLSKIRPIENVQYPISCKKACNYRSRRRSAKHDAKFCRIFISVWSLDCTVLYQKETKHLHLIKKSQNPNFLAWSKIGASNSFESSMNNDCWPD